jgi:hypothetical protein
MAETVVESHSIDLEVGFSDDTVEEDIIKYFNKKGITNLAMLLKNSGENKVGSILVI